ncbi:hypothetical protein BASA81_008415 [Batrachochytrium salamandrivorans]|nr:hypothetical protein BASA81_008415 [Batrachochytrium salamandrivorans]
MGVHDLWKLLKPCGTVVDLASLQGKTLAIDASIWLTQFLKAMRDEETGQMTEYAHLLGTIRRICKLLYYGIKPVFVFDGGVPLLKTQVMRNRRNNAHR